MDNLVLNKLLTQDLYFGPKTERTKADRGATSSVLSIKKGKLHISKKCSKDDRTSKKAVKMFATAFAHTDLSAVFIERRQRFHRNLDRLKRCYPKILEGVQMEGALLPSNIIAHIASFLTTPPPQPVSYAFQAGLDSDLAQLRRLESLKEGMGRDQFEAFERLFYSEYPDGTLKKKVEFIYNSLTDEIKWFTLGALPQTQFPDLEALDPRRIAEMNQYLEDINLINFYSNLTNDRIDIRHYTYCEMHLTAEDFRKTLKEHPLRIYKEIVIPPNCITRIPREIGLFKNLRELKITERAITFLPKELFQCTQLTSLKMLSNSITMIPSEIINLPFLHKLRISDNKITSVPKEVFFLPSLLNLNLEMNKMTHFSIPEEAYSPIEILNIFCNRITFLPPQIKHLNMLSDFSCAENAITELPDELFSLSRLRHLYLDTNKIRFIPKEIRNLTCLESLSLCNNNLTQLPSDLCELSCLKILAIFENPLTSLPRGIHRMRSLQELSLDRDFFERHYDRLLRYFQQLYSENDCFDELVCFTHKASL